jgi:hypothetical protein
MQVCEEAGGIAHLVPALHADVAQTALVLQVCSKFGTVSVVH